MGDINNSGAADSYIGSLISLTSKSEIRYEGILYTVDTANSNIALQDVRSFGTEGRKKDGPQIPASDKVYDYIIFRGTDIKDLQVKSSPPTRQTQSQQPHHDPAIISLQSQTSPMAPPIAAGNVQAPVASMTTAPAKTDGINLGPFSGIPSASYQANMPPIYQPYSGLGSWAMPPIPPGTNGAMGMPMYWPGYFRPHSAISHLQQQSPLSFPSPTSLPNYLTQSRSSPQQPLPAPPSIPTSALPEAHQLFSQTLSAKDTLVNSSQELVTSNILSSTFSSAFQASPSSILSTDEKVRPSKFASPMTSPAISISQLNGSLIAASGIPALESAALLDSTKSLESQKQPVISDQLSLDQFLTPDPLISIASTSQGQGSANQPLLPLPVHSKQSNQGYSLPSKSMFGRKGRGRGRGIGNSASQNQFMEDFDFTAMNEKFKKDEVWGELGKADFRDKVEGEEDILDEASCEEEDFSRAAPVVYVKDEFFDTLSCDSYDRGGQNERTKFSEQRKIDTETFGRFSVRSRGGRGGRGGFRGNSRGGYHSGRPAGHGGKGGRSFSRNTAGF